MIQRSLPSAMLFALMLGACQSGPSKETEQADVIALVRSGRYGQAVAAAQRVVDNDPENAQAQRNLRDASMALLMDRGRTLTFQGHTEEGLELFYEVQAMDESREVARDWINKARIQLAEDYLTLSGTLTAREQLEERQGLLVRVLAYLPEIEDSERVENLRLLASSSLARVEENLAYCVTRGQECFDDGIGSLAEARYHQSLRDFSASVGYDKNRDEAVDSYRRVNVLVGEDLLQQALDYEDLGLFNAARMEFERVHKRAPGNQQATEGLNRMEREVRAGRLIDRAAMSMLRGSLEEAGDFLDDAASKTQVQEHRIEEMRVSIRGSSWEESYQGALSLEAGGFLPEAVEAYAELLAVADEYKETSVRKAILEEFIAKASALYAKAAVAEEPAEEFALLREIQVLWPEYRDVKARVQALEAEFADGQPDGESESRRPMDRRAQDGEGER